MNKFEPKIICFFCKWCTSAGESNKLVNTMKEFINQIKSLGTFPKMEWKEELEDV